MKIDFLEHALARMKVRGITRKEVENAINRPDESYEDELGLVVHKLITDPATGQKVLLRVFYQNTLGGIEIISTYITSQIKKYWRGT